ncbi:MAG: hypothetical protein HZB10_02265 [Candidatus Yonathbacteria bacterium]|nr:hypothetical protein [Candidatus Yonathbacteria bacterium]
MIAMLAAGFRKKPEAKEEKVDMIATLKRPVKAGALCGYPMSTEDAKKLLGEEQLIEIDRIVNSLIGFRYSACPIKKLAVPRSKNLRYFYSNLARNELVRDERAKLKMPNRRLKPRGLDSASADWGDYTINVSTIHWSFKDVSTDRISTEALEARGGPMFGKKLLYVIENLVGRAQTTVEAADIRYFSYLEKNPDKVPAVMKNGKANIFAGTTIAISSTLYLIASTWKGTCFEAELVPLTYKLEDVAQFVMIRR